MPSIDVPTGLLRIQGLLNYILGSVAANNKTDYVLGSLASFLYDELDSSFGCGRRRRVYIIDPLDQSTLLLGRKEPTWAIDRPKRHDGFRVWLFMDFAALTAQQRKHLVRKRAKLESMR